MFAAALLRGGQFERARTFYESLSRFRLAAQAASVLNPSGGGDKTRLLGTELWSGESAVTRASALGGAWFSAISDTRYKRFVNSYEARFGSQPYRIATLGYDAVLLTLRVARDWRVGRDFPQMELADKVGSMVQSGGI